VFTEFNRGELSRDALVASFFGRQRERHAQA
jgi:hypothetical protein